MRAAQLATASLLRAAVVALSCAAAAPASAQVAADEAATCPQCVAWNVPQEPFRVFGNTYYVGTAELAAILVVGDDGLVLLDAALPQSAPLIDANIRALGFDTADVRLIGNSHTHFDHAGGIAAVQRASKATVAASARAAEALRAGKPNTDDPQFTSPDNTFPRVENVRVFADGESLTVGNVQITAHLTPGHTPGGTSWSWRSCEGSRCLDVVYADSLNAVSADGFRFSAGSPPTADTLQRSIDKVAALPCDILLAPHPGFIGMQEKLRQRTAGETDAFVDANACRDYAAAARTRLERRLADERAGTL